MIGPCELVPGTYNAGKVETEVGNLSARASASIIDNQKVLVLMRPSELEVTAASKVESSTARIEQKEYQGEFTEYGVRLDSGVLLRVRRRASDALAEGQSVIIKTRNNSAVLVFGD
jgi:ABC-type Fe3+/spermidine/putrescine transport system ATPase subunit